jgi:hypothetical protein
MTKREKVLASSLAGIVVVGGGLVLLQMALLAPLQERNAEVALLDEEIRKKEDEYKASQATLDRAKKLSPRLEKWKQLSLPPAADGRPETITQHLKELQVPYERHLSELLQRNGFAPGSIAVNSKAVEAPRTGASAAKGPPPVYRTLTFTVQGQAGMDGIEKMLEEFHREPLLQQVRLLTIQKSQDRSAPPGRLELTMTVEALVVAGAEKRDDLMPASSARPQVLAEPARTYADLATHNIFTGTVKAATQSEDSRDVLGFVKLTTVSNVNGRRWEAWLRDQWKPEGETKLRSSTGFNEFSFSDRYENVLVKAVVVRIDETGVLFRANGRFYHIGMGESLYDAMREPAQGPLPAAGAALGAAWAAKW